jgi:signal transduction histidine kinase
MKGSNEIIRQRLLSAISRADSFDELGRIIVETLADEFDVEVSTIWRRYTDDNGAPRLRLLAASAKAPQTLAQEITYAFCEDATSDAKADGVTGYVAQTRREVHVSSFEELKRKYGKHWRGLMDKTQWEGDPMKNFHSLVALPLLLGNSVVGVLKLENKRNSPGGFSLKDRGILKGLVPDIALSVQSLTLLEGHEERLIGVPAKMVAALTGPFDPSQLVSEIVKTVAEMMQAEICSLWLVDPNGKELRLADRYGFSAESTGEQSYQLSDPNVPDDEIDGITAWVAVRKKPFWANSWTELKGHPSWSGKWDDAMWHKRDQTFRCLYSVPLLRENKVIGVLKVENRKGAAFFTDSDRAMCGIMANLIVLVHDWGRQLRVSVLTDLAHLIRSPIGQVSVNLASVEREIRSFEKTKRIRLDLIETCIDFMKKALLAVSVTSRTLTAFAQKAEVLNRDDHPERVWLADLMKERLLAMQPLLPSGIIVNTNIEEHADNISIQLDVTDRTRIASAFDNIVHNAVKYSKPNGVVTVSLKREGMTAVLIVNDQGCGISADDLARVFDAGFSRRAQGHPEGTGMGLTTVKQILERLRWAHDIKSWPGEGTTFRINIPLKEGD